MSTQEQKVARHVQGATGLLYTTCLAATRSARLRVEKGPDFTKRWQDLAIRDAKARGLTTKTAQPKTTARVYFPGEDGRGVPKKSRQQWRKAVANQHGEAAAGMAESSVLADEQRREWAQRQSRGVEGELKSLPKQRKP